VNTPLLLLVLFSPFLSQSNYDRGMTVPDVSVCDLVESADRYDKRTVFTEGLMVPSEHSVGLYSPQCRPTEKNDFTAQVTFDAGWDKSAQGRNLTKLLRKQRTAKVRVEGVFLASGGPYGPDRARFRFVVNHVLTAK
jgi:hypothetical protein